MLFVVRKRTRLLAQLKILIALLALFALLSLPYRILSGKLAWWFWDRGDYAIAYYVNWGDAQLAMNEGFYYFGNGAYDLPKAIGAFKLALALEPGVLWGHYQLGRIYFVEGKFDLAMQELNAELAANPANLRTLYERALVEEAENDLSVSEADLKRFTQWAPTEWGGYNDLAFVEAKEGKYAQSEMTIDQAMQKVPDAQDIPWLWNSLGLAQLNQLHYTQAQSSFEQAFALAQKLTPEEWVRAYSANDPAAAAQSIKNFQAAIGANLHMAQAGLSI